MVIDIGTLNSHWNIHRGVGNSPEIIPEVIVPAPISENVSKDRAISLRGARFPHSMETNTCPGRTAEPPAPECFGRRLNMQGVLTSTGGVGVSRHQTNKACHPIEAPGRNEHHPRRIHVTPLPCFRFAAALVG